MGNQSNDFENVDHINISKVFFGFVYFVRRKILSIFLFWAISTILFLLYFFFLLTPVYKSNMVVYSTNYTLEDFSVLVNNLNNLIESRSYKEVGKILSISPKEAENIQKFTVTLVEFNKTIKEKSINNKENKFDIGVSVSDNLILGKLNLGFRDYVLKNPFLIAVSNEKRAYINSLMTKIDREENALDSLKSKLLKGTSINPLNKSSIIFGNLGEMYESSVKLHRQRLDLDYEMRFGVDFVVINEFSPNVPVVNKDLIKYLLICSFVSILFIIIVLGFLESAKKYSA